METVSSQMPQVPWETLPPSTTAREKWASRNFLPGQPLPLPNKSHYYDNLSPKGTPSAPVCSRRWQPQKATTPTCTFFPHLKYPSTALWHPCHSSWTAVRVSPTSPNPTSTEFLPIRGHQSLSSFYSIKLASLYLRSLQNWKWRLTDSFATVYEQTALLTLSWTWLCFQRDLHR